MRSKPFQFSVIYGGRSVEHDVSVSMYQKMCREIALADGPTLSGVHFITKNGEYICETVQGTMPPSHDEMCSSLHRRSITDLPKLVKSDGSFLFSLLVGRDGEDGRIQGVAEFFGFLGSFGSVDASSLGINKWAFGILAEHATGGRVKVIPGSLVRPSRSIAEIDRAIDSVAGYPCVVKPNRQGSSFGVRAIESATPHAIRRYFDEFKDFDTEFLVQRRIVGREITCGCLQDLNHISTLDVVEVVTSSQLFGYEAKWQGEPYSLSSLPDSYDRRLVENVSETLMSTFSIHTMARFDYILADDGLYVLEVNTVPGMSALSIYPAMLARKGLGLLDVIDVARRNEQSRIASIASQDAAVARWSVSGFARL
jgi:D-alanine-D-alanine ligase